MDLFLDFGFAWISVFLTIILSVVYILRIIIKKKKYKNNVFTSINKGLRKHHKLIGVLLIATGLIHGYFSSVEVLSLNLGTVAWIFSILLGLNFIFRKTFSHFKGWIYYHRILTLAFILTIVVHVVQVGGIQVFDIIANSSNNTITSDGTSNITPGTTFQGATFKDGTYTGTANGFRSGMKVSVTIKDNQITSIKVVSSNDTREYLNRAMKVIQFILTNQTTEVDSVSSATYSSIGIKNAVKDALSQAVISGTIPTNQSLPSSPRGEEHDDEYDD